ncbi:DUF2867 domain-containing protein [Nocardia thailandica]|uniref:DUF2867 domain-containing protein n=1 Tax=Nocardia thailandica TaxID=257275 RepID=A0ABW6PIR1_9NOCA
MRIPTSAHTERPWRIHEIAPEFEVEDVWRFDTPGGRRDDFAPFLDALRHRRAAEQRGVTGALFALRWKLGALLGWDRAEDGLGGRVASLRDRLPADLLAHPAPEDTAGPFRALYLLDDEYAAEIANNTMHGVLHLGWVADGDAYHLRMAVLVAPNGRWGRAYMALIKPFRHLVVYPAMTRSWERAWRDLARTR